MIRYTNEFLTDGDITIERVANRLKLISEGIKNSNKLNGRSSGSISFHLV